MKSDIKLDDVLIAIRAHCMECSGGCKKEVENCRIKTCSLRPYRSLNAIGASRNEKHDKRQISMFDLQEKEGEKDGRQKRSGRTRNDKRSGIAR